MGKMYCAKCGYSSPIQTRFCPNCGNELTSSFRSSGYPLKGSEGLLFSLRPRFLGFITALTMVPVALFFTVWGGLFFGGFGFFAIQIFHLNVPYWFTFVFFALLFLVSIPLIGYLAKKKTYEKTEYRFYPDKLEYYEGFFNVEEKTIDYSNITEVSLRKGVIQRGHNLGTIILSTPATPVYVSGRGMPFSGIRILDIENPDENYTKIKALVGK